MPRWLVCTMDNGIILEHPTKRAAVDSVMRSTYGPLKPRRLRVGDYEYQCGCDSDHCPTYWIMTEDVARRHGVELDDN